MTGTLSHTRARGFLFIRGAYVIGGGGRLESETESESESESEKQKQTSEGGSLDLPHEVCVCACHLSVRRVKWWWWWWWTMMNRHVDGQGTVGVGQRPCAVGEQLQGDRAVQKVGLQGYRLRRRHAQPQGGGVSTVTVTRFTVTRFTRKESTGR